MAESLLLRRWVAPALALFLLGQAPLWGQVQSGPGVQERPESQGEPDPGIATTIDAIRVGRTPERTRVVFDLNAAPRVNLFDLAAPDRLVIDFQGASARLPTAPDFADTPVLRLRSARRNAEDLRVVFDLANPPPRYKYFTLPPDGGRGYRLVVDLYAQEAKESQERAGEAIADTGAAGAAMIDDAAGPSGLTSRATPPTLVMLATRRSSALPRASARPLPGLLRTHRLTMRRRVRVPPRPRVATAEP